MSESPANPFGPDVIDAVAAHMNRDHADDSLLIVRALGGKPEATEARVRGVDGEAIEFAVILPAGATTVRVPWTQRLTERAQIRAEVTSMYHQACEIIGVPPRGAGEH